MRYLLFIALITCITACGDICENNCPFSGNGICEDVDQGSTLAQCEYGYDCDDCGPRPRKR